MPDTNAFFTAVLNQMGLASSPWRLEFFREWTAFESGRGDWGADWNPLNTTQHMPGDRDLNGDPNQNGGNPLREYPDYQTGVSATVNTLTNGYYPLVIQALRDERIPAGMTANIRTWGSVSFADIIDGGWKPSAPAPVFTIGEEVARLKRIVAGNGARAKDGTILRGEAALVDQDARGNSLALGLALMQDTIQQLAFIVGSMSQGATPEQVIAALQVILNRASAPATK